MPRIFALDLTALTTLRLYGGPPPMLVAPRLNATQMILSSPAIIIHQGTTLHPGLTDSMQLLSFDLDDSMHELRRPGRSFRGRRPLGDVRPPGRIHLFHDRGGNQSGGMGYGFFLSHRGSNQ
jgi:hypothetical protein